VGWDPEKVSRRRIELMLEDPRTAPEGFGALVIDETGDRKDGKATAHAGKQYVGGIGKIENGAVSVSSLYAEERLYYPLEMQPCKPRRKPCDPWQELARQERPMVPPESTL
jgi:SRSO17 transposase